MNPAPTPQAPQPQAASDAAVRGSAEHGSAAGGFDPVRLIETYQAGVWRYMRAMGCDPALAEDLTQETFLHVLQRPFQEVNPAATSAYLRKTALNLLISHKRRSGKVLAVEDVELLDRTWSRWAGQDGGDAALDALRDCLTRLTQRARKALEMRFRGEHSRTEIAEALEITEHGAKNLMQRAKQQLRECIEARIAAAQQSDSQAKPTGD